MAVHKKRQRLLLLLLAVNLTFIWGNSLLTPEQSNAISDRVTEAVGGELVTDDSPAPERWLTSSHIRKLAHILEFASLGVLSAVCARSGEAPARRYLPCLALFGMTTALLDETLQLLSERTSSVKDVWLDCAGFALGALVACVVMERCHAHKTGTSSSETTAKP